MNPPILFTISIIQNLKTIPVSHKHDPIQTFYYSIQPTRTIQHNRKNNLQFGNPIQKGPVKHCYTKQTQYHKTKQSKENLNSDNPIRTVGFHLQGLQTAAFVLAVVSGTLQSHQARPAPQSCL